MTREEIINALSMAIDTLYDMEASASNFSNVGRCNEARHELEDVIKRLQEQLSLPSNLFEASLQAAQADMCNRQIMEASNDDRLRYSRIFRRGFKAGAEWMAKQIENH